MKRILSLSLLVLASFNVHAQGLMAGLRANAGYRLEANEYSGEGDLTTLSGEHLSLAPDVFLRYEAKRNWAVEASFNQTRNKHTIISTNWYGWPDTIDSRAKYYDLTFSAQYKLGGRQFRNSGVLKSLHHYLGVSLGMLFVSEELRYSSRLYGTEGAIRNNKAHSFWTGLNYAMAINLGKHLNLLSGAYFKLCPDVIFTSDEVNFYRYLKAQFGLQLGAAYRIF